jgi:hypothetical protein
MVVVTVGSVGIVARAAILVMTVHRVVAVTVTSEGRAATLVTTVHRVVVMMIVVRVFVMVMIVRVVRLVLVRSGMVVVTVGSVGIVARAAILVMTVHRAVRVAMRAEDACSATVDDQSRRLRHNANEKRCAHVPAGVAQKTFLTGHQTTRQSSGSMRVLPVSGENESLLQRRKSARRRCERSTRWSQSSRKLSGSATESICNDTKQH